MVAKQRRGKDGWQACPGQLAQPVAPSALNRAASRPRRPWKALGLLGCLSLTGCGAIRGLPEVMFIAIGTGSEQTITADLRQEAQDRLGTLAAGFRQIHPNTSLQLGLYPESQIAAAMQRRRRAGLEPDLLYVNGDTALKLLEAGLVDPVPAEASQLRVFDPEELQRLRLPDGRLAGLPVLVQTQLGCFNRKRLSQAPSTLKELLSVSARGHNVGLSLDLPSLIWTLGSVGALSGFETALRGEAVSAAQGQAIEEWLTWLQTANNQQWVTFYPDPKTAQQEFLAGRVDWIPCRSTVVPLLRRERGQELEVAPLPNGEGHTASPLNILRVMALGRDSTARGRQRALAFMAYSINPLTQRSITLGSQTMLPANRFVTVPVQSSRMLNTIVTAAAQGQQANSLVALLNRDDRRIPRIQALLVQLVFGDIQPKQARLQLIQVLQEQP